MSNIVGYLNLYDSPSLGELTNSRTPASTSFIGRFALMDFALSNFTNANITNINVLVKDNFRSVAKHCGSLKNWVRNTKRGKQNFLINERGIADPAYNSDLNAIRENDWVLYDANADYVIVQPAHIVTVLNLTDLIAKHIASGADVTMVYKTIDDADEAFLSSHILKLEGDKATVNGKTYDINVKAGIEQKASSGSAEGEEVKAALPGNVLRIEVSEGDQVAEGDVLMVVEAMKMETEIKSPKAGTVKSIEVSQGDKIVTGQALVILG